MQSDTERERERMEQRLCEAAIAGDEEALNQIIEEDEMILDKLAVGCLSKSPLHVAVSCGRANFVMKLLYLKPKLAQVLDSADRSALHLAAAEGNLEIVTELVKVKPEMCLARDRDGLNPLHIAAINGWVHVLAELVRVRAHAARARIEREETVLHLCVKYQQFAALKKLMEIVDDDELVDAKDSAGNTILHLAVSAKQFEIAKYILEKTKEVNATNTSGHTAMDILLAQSRSTEENANPNMEDYLVEKEAKRAGDLLQGVWVTKKRDSLMVVASLIATIAFQAGVSPPGGVWQDDSGGHRAGEAVMAYHYPDSYPWFIRSATVGFVASLSIILLIISGLPMRNKIYMWILMVIMWLTITAMAATYAVSIVWVTPKKDRRSLTHTIIGAVIAWCSVMAVLLLVHTIRLAGSIVKEQHTRHKSIRRINEALDQMLPPFICPWIKVIRKLNVIRMFRRSRGQRNAQPGSAKESQDTV